MSCSKSAGELQNDERTAGVVLQMVQSCGKLMNTCSADRKGNFHRMSGLCWCGWCSMCVLHCLTRFSCVSGLHPCGMRLESKGSHCEEDEQRCLRPCSNVCVSARSFICVCIPHVVVLMLVCVCAEIIWFVVSNHACHRLNAHVGNV